MHSDLRVYVMNIIINKRAHSLFIATLKLATGPMTKASIIYYFMHLAIFYIIAMVDVIHISSKVFGASLHLVLVVNNLHMFILLTLMPVSEPITEL